MNDLFLRACKRQPVERTPIWLMRQAGRCLPEYRKVREGTDFTTLCRTPDLAVEVSLQPLDRLGVDAVIFFSDILVPAEAMGFEIDFVPGPVVASPVRCAADVDRVLVSDPEEKVPYVYEILRNLRRELEGRVPLIGFAASPFTLAAYLIEGQGSRVFEKTKGLFAEDPQTAHRFLEKVTEVTERYLVAQVKAGAQAIQLFDTWAGLLNRNEYREFVLPYATRILDRLKQEDVARIYFALNGAHLMAEVRECGADVIGVDWRTDLSTANRLLDGPFALQGNLDPCVLMAGPEVIERRATEVLRQAQGLSGHIFNLGHGVLPTTPVEHVEALVRIVQAYRG